MSSLEDCPYHCNNGKLMDYELKKIVPCPYCSEKKNQLAKDGLAEDTDGSIISLPTMLGINNKYLNSKFIYESVIPDGEKVFLDEESVKKQGEVLEDIYLGLGVGELPERSYCIGLGYKGSIDRVAYPLLAKAYLSGLSVAKFISCTQYNRMCINMSDEVEGYYTKDLVIILIQDGASKADIASAKGLMQTRALNGKCTIFLTTWVIEACSMLLGYPFDDTFFLATGVFVEYKVGKNKKKSHYINQLTGVENETYNEDKEDGSFKGTHVVSMDDLLGS